VSKARKWEQQRKAAESQKKQKKLNGYGG